MKTGFVLDVAGARKVMDAQIKTMARAATGGMKEATGGLKDELRAQVTSVGLGPKLAQSWQGKAYPDRGGNVSLSPAGLVFSKANELLAAYAAGATIRPTGGRRFLAIPTPAALGGRRGYRSRGGFDDLTPQEWERRNGAKLRFVQRRGKNAVLVLDEGRLTKGGVARVGRSKKLGPSGKGATIVLFILVPQVKITQRPMDIKGAAERWQAALPELIAAEVPMG